MSERPPRFLRHRAVDKVIEIGPSGELAAMPSDSAALAEFATEIGAAVNAPGSDVFDARAANRLSEFVLIDCSDGGPIAYSPPHRFGKFWIVPRLWLFRENRVWTLLAPYPHTDSYRNQEVLRINRGQRITTLERDDCSMVVMAPPLEAISDCGGLSVREDDGISIC